MYLLIICIIFYVNRETPMFDDRTLLRMRTIVVQNKLKKIE